MRRYSSSTTTTATIPPPGKALYGEARGAGREWAHHGGANRQDLPREQRYYTYWTRDPRNNTVRFGQAAEWYRNGLDRQGNIRWVQWTRDSQHRGLAGGQSGRPAYNTVSGISSRTAISTILRKLNITGKSLGAVIGQYANTTASLDMLSVGVFYTLILFKSQSSSHISRRWL